MFALLTDITETKQLRSLQQLIMSALADEIPITEISDQLCKRVEEIAPDVVSSLLHIDAGGLIHPLGGTQPSRRLLPGVGWRRDRSGHRFLRIRGILRQGRPGDGS